MQLTAGEALETMAELPVVEPGEFVRRGLVVVAPHPDDESLGCGGLIAACRAVGQSVSIVIVSDGTGSHPNSRLFPPARLAQLRRQEVIYAVGRLGVAASDIHFLDLPDRGVPSEGVLAEDAIARIAAVIGQADVMAVTWRHDPHKDHQASFALARGAAQQVPGVALWEFPIWGLTLNPLTPLGGMRQTGVRVRIEDHLSAKRRAIAAHESQITNMISDDPQGFRLSPSMLSLFDTPCETYLKATP